MYDMNTLTINITLPKQMKKAVDAQVKSGLYTSFSEFVRNAIRARLFSFPHTPYGQPFSAKAEKEILRAEKKALANRDKNIVLKNPQEIRAFFKSL
jgi:hypothetical protein